MSNKGAKTFGKPRPKAEAGLAGGPITAVVNAYKLTGVYVKGRDAIFADSPALDRFNLWVAQNQAEISPAEQAVCMTCGTVSYQLCCHRVQTLDVAVPKQTRPGKGFWSRLSEWWSPKPDFDFGVTNNRKTKGFDNSSIPDSEIITECYNYITANMQTSYTVAGVEMRELRLAHSHRLGLRWAEVYDMRDLIVDDTYFKNRLLFTIQRAADTTERRVLYKYTDPEADFGIAWLPILWTIFVVLSTVLFTVLVMGGLFAWLDDQPQLDEHAVLRCVATMTESLRPVPYGNQLLSVGTKRVICNVVEQTVAQLGPLSKFWSEVVQEFRY